MTDSLSKSVESFLADRPEVWAHTQAVVEAAKRYARHFKVDIEATGAAAWLHDLSKSWPEETLLQYVAQFDLSLDESTKASRKLLEAPVAAALAEQEFGIRNPLILEAIRFHTTGHAGMSDVAMCLYLGDKLSADRVWDDVPELQEFAETHFLKEAMLAVQSSVLIHLLEKRLPLHRDSLDCYHGLIAEVSN